jgi:hypothetical protein
MSGLMTPYGEIVKDMEYFREIGKPYKYQRSGSSMVAYINGVKHFTSTVNQGRADIGLPSKQLYFIMKVKRYIAKNDLVNIIQPNYKKRTNIKFICLNNDIEVGEVFSSPYSIDINAAYWESAFKAGWISYELYQEGKGVDKRIRLASLGSYAKRIYNYEYSGRGEERMTGITEPAFPHVFFNQANTVFRLMEKCRREIKEEFLFYWTDGIYVKNKQAAKKCVDILNKLGYESKTEKLIRVTRLPNGFETKEKKLIKDGKYKIKEKLYRSNFE